MLIYYIEDNINMNKMHFSLAAIDEKIFQCNVAILNNKEFVKRSKVLLHNIQQRMAQRYLEQFKPKKTKQRRKRT